MHSGTALLLSVVFAVVYFFVQWLIRRKPVEVPKTDAPPCAKWKVWLGKEIEGTYDLGEETLFIRNLTGMTFVEARDTCPHVKRVWFCKEFITTDNFNIMCAALEQFESVCVEVDQWTIMPQIIWDRARIYYKVAVPLKTGDQVCVGNAFSDESFEVGEGRKVDPSMYLQDEQIL